LTAIMRGCHATTQDLGSSQQPVLILDAWRQGQELFIRRTERYTVARLAQPQPESHPVKQPSSVIGFLVVAAPMPSPAATPRGRTPTQPPLEPVVRPHT